MNLQTRIWTDKITRIVADYKRLAAASEAAEKAGCLEIEGNLNNAIWRSHSELLSQCDFAGWVSWYLYDNDCGTKKLSAKHNGKAHRITTPAQLANLIVKIQATQ